MAKFDKLPPDHQNQAKEKNDSIEDATKSRIKITTAFFRGDLGIEDATKPTLEITAATIDLEKKPEEETDLGIEELLPEFVEEIEEESALKNVKVEASVGETVNLGNMEFFKVTAGLSGDVGRKGRKAAWKEAWEEVEIQKSEELIKFLKARVRR